jgi:predicted nucleic acid-binding protein
MFDLGIEWTSPSREVLTRAVDIAHRYQITVYDAVFVALAVVLDVNLVTADKHLADRLASLATVQFLGQIDSESFKSP